MKRATIDEEADVSDNNKKKWASELLELEKLYQKGTEFSDQQSERWHTLVGQIFGDENAQHGRRSFRLPAQAPCTLKIGQGRFDCRILEVSRLGLSVEGLVLRHITHEHVVTVLSVSRAGQEHSLDLPCSVARLDPQSNPPFAGLILAAEATTEVRQRYFDQIYYPFYLEFLAELAKGSAA